jgi:hypothetical protein
MGPSGEVRETLQGTGIGLGAGPSAAPGRQGPAKGELLSLEQLQAMAQKDDKQARKKVCHICCLFYAGAVQHAVAMEH